MKMYHLKETIIIDDDDEKMIILLMNEKFSVHECDNQSEKLDLWK